MRKRIAELQDPCYTLISDSQERRAVLEHIGQPDEYQHLLIWAENGAYRQVWGIESTPPLLVDSATLLYAEG